MTYEALFDGSGNFLGVRAVSGSDTQLNDQDGHPCVRYTLTAAQHNWVQTHIRAGTLPDTLPLAGGWSSDVVTGLVTGTVTGLGSL